MHIFYKQPKILVWIESILLLIIGLIPALFIIEQSNERPVCFFLFIAYVPIGQFAFTPFFRQIGVYTYYSPMLLGYMANEKQIDLHSGTGFDYLFAMRQCKPGVAWRNKLLTYHLEGLVNLIQLVENKSIPESVKIVGTSYFFNQRTLEKLGFEVERPSMSYRINLFINFLDLIWMFSLSKGSFSIPKLWSVQKASISGEKLMSGKKEFEQLLAKMKTKMN